MDEANDFNVEAIIEDVLFCPFVLASDEGH